MLKKFIKCFIFTLQGVWIVGTMLLSISLAIGFYDQMTGNTSQFGMRFKILESLFGATTMYTTLDYIIWWIGILFGPIYLVCFVCYIYKQLNIAGSIIQAGCDAFGDLPSAFLVPIVSIFLMVGVFVFWIYVMMGVVANSISGQYENTFFYHVEMDSTFKFQMLYVSCNLV